MLREELPMIPNSFTFQFEETAEHGVRVSFRSNLGNAGPIELTHDQADLLADLVSSMFDILHEAQSLPKGR
jgi:hypothetical protein